MVVVPQEAALEAAREQAEGLAAAQEALLRKQHAQQEERVRVAAAAAAKAAALPTRLDEIRRDADFSRGGGGHGGGASGGSDCGGGGCGGAAGGSAVAAWGVPAVLEDEVAAVQRRLAQHSRELRAEAKELEAFRSVLVRAVLLLKRQRLLQPAPCTRYLRAFCPCAARLAACLAARLAARLTAHLAARVRAAGLLLTQCVVTIATAAAAAAAAWQDARGTAAAAQPAAGARPAPPPLKPPPPQAAAAGGGLRGARAGVGCSAASSSAYELRTLVDGYAAEESWWEQYRRDVLGMPVGGGVVVTEVE